MPIAHAASENGQTTFVCENQKTDQSVPHWDAANDRGTYTSLFPLRECYEVAVCPEWCAKRKDRL